MIFERRQYNVWRQFYWDGSFCCKCEVPKCSLLRPASLSCDVSLLSSLVSRVNSIKCRSIVSFRLEFRTRGIESLSVSVRPLSRHPQLPYVYVSYRDKVKPYARGLFAFYQKVQGVVGYRIYTHDYNIPHWAPTGIFFCALYRPIFPSVGAEKLDLPSRPFS